MVTGEFDTLKQLYNDHLNRFEQSLTVRKELE